MSSVTVGATGTLFQRVVSLAVTVMFSPNIGARLSLLAGAPKARRPAGMGAHCDRHIQNPRPSESTAVALFINAKGQEVQKFAVLGVPLVRVPRKKSHIYTVQKMGNHAILVTDGCIEAIEWHSEA
ncbi:hypothetical protein BC629DRAFT_1443940 [Irpex lacteus]|nr:hypothetical protein BC629DRAFT_1443940 [Irpex lacteus]